MLGRLLLLVCHLVVINSIISSFVIIVILLIVGASHCSIDGSAAASSVRSVLVVVRAVVPAVSLHDKLGKLLAHATPHAPTQLCALSGHHHAHNITHTHLYNDARQHLRQHSDVR
jgi:cytochrome c-type biogenesis protein CcmH/NrfG